MLNIYTSGGSDLRSIVRALFVVALLGGAFGGLVSPPRATAQGEASTTAVAFQRFQHGFMFWREDTDRIAVGYTDIRTKSGAPCQELYRDTFQGQPYEIPPAPPGLTVPTLGFGWLYANDRQLAQRLGYALAEEESRVADIRTTTAPDGQQIVEVTFGEPIEGVANPLRLSSADEPGLTYCFARRQENRDVTNTWIAVQRFQHGFMMWRQDRPATIDVVHYDTEYAPELWCSDTLQDAWRPGMAINYGSLAVPGRRLPERGFGKLWTEHEYVQRSLGYPIEPESGGFAEISYSRFDHPTRGPLLIRTMTVHRADGADQWRWTTIAGATNPEDDGRIDTGCSTLLIPHQGTH